MRGSVTIKSVTAKIEKLEKMEASLVRKLEDVRKQIAEQRIKKNELIAKMITSQVSNLDEAVLQKILNDYSQATSEGAENEKTAPASTTEEKGAAPAEEKEGAESSTASPAHNESAPHNAGEAAAEQGIASKPEQAEDQEDEEDDDDDDEYAVKPSWEK